MRKQLFFIAIASLFTSMASAADLYVRDLGAGGSYSTISAAITAANDGDRIIIRPKAGNLPFIENLTIDKSLSFVSEINFSNYLVQGTVSIIPLSGRVVSVQNMNLTSTFTSSADSANGRTTINVYNSTLNGGIAVNKLNTSLNISGCTVTGTISCTHGRITGNTANKILVSTNVADTSLALDDIEIIANAVLGSNEAIWLIQKNYKAKILNNYCAFGNITFTDAKNLSENEIRNNVISSGSNTGIYIGIPTGNNATFYVLNNVICPSNSSSSYYEVTNSTTATATVYVRYNASNSGFTILNCIASNNISSASISFNATTSNATGSALVNAGAIEDDFADINLTRNDIGNRGGSDSWENYWPTAAGNKPQVNYLNTPRRIYSGTTEMNATGSGYSK
ncbi:hypothetical protein GV828_02545 [Flavobacterium sp. NST-5]|uniref:Right handed beta helix domain-containing protein n=1 Tax=Flavobacterium ichthyis TaxID=2698827 RepID=A0ABW9Z785_9FLAO|nr:hypothetical protein [Flavobacterium ichthyis]NBL64076.1 hypothetical protein [Flavobacterium ichthyis]